MRVEFRESDHTYWLGDRQLPSVTRLLKKHGLATDYTGVDAAVLTKAAERGSLIHKEIEDYIKGGEIGFTSELADFIRIVQEMNFTPTKSEVILPEGDIPDDKADDVIYAGTADLIGEIAGALVLADIKTTYKVDKRAYAWQLALYERLCGVRFPQWYIFHLGADSRAIPIERVPDAEVDKLIECERKGEIYQKAELMVPDELALQVQHAERALKDAQAAADAAKAVVESYREKLYELMTEQDIVSWETPDKTVLVTRIAPQTKTTVDSTKLKKELPDIYAKYTKTTQQKGYIKVTVRDNGE